VELRDDEQRTISVCTAFPCDDTTDSKSQRWENDRANPLSVAAVVRENDRTRSQPAVRTEGDGAVRSLSRAWMIGCTVRTTNGSP